MTCDRCDKPEHDGKLCREWRDRDKEIRAQRTLEIVEWLRGRAAIKRYIDAEYASELLTALADELEAELDT